MNFREKLLGGLGKAKKAIVESPFVQNPVVRNLGESFDRDPVKTTGMSVALAAGVAGLGAAAGEMSKSQELLTPESFSAATPQESAAASDQETVVVKLEDTEQIIKIPKNEGER